MTSWHHRRGLGIHKKLRSLSQLLRLVVGQMHFLLRQPSSKRSRVPMAWQFQPSANAGPTTMKHNETMYPIVSEHDHGSDPWNSMKVNDFPTKNDECPQLWHKFPNDKNTKRLGACNPMAKIGQALPGSQPILAWLIYQVVTAYLSPGMMCKARPWFHIDVLSGDPGRFATDGADWWSPLIHRISIFPVVYQLDIILLIQLMIPIKHS